MIQKVKLLLLPLAFLALTPGLVPDSAAAVYVPVRGQVIDSRTDKPVPGLNVWLVHPTLGRGAVSVTDANGRFGWNSIQTRFEPYYLEVYWGSKLVYRRAQRVRNAVSIPPIRL